MFDLFLRIPDEGWAEMDDVEAAVLPELLAKEFLGRCLSQTQYL